MMGLFDFKTVGFLMYALCFCFYFVTKGLINSTMTNYLKVEKSNIDTQFMDKFVTVKVITIILRAMFIITTPIYLMALGKPILEIDLPLFVQLNSKFKYLFSDSMMILLPLCSMLCFLAIISNYWNIIKSKITAPFIDNHVQ